MKTHILCLGDSNTHGYCADPKDNADGGIRFNEDERWTCRLQTALGDKYLVTEEGLSGRTTVFADPIHESMDALSVAYPLLKSHEVIDLLIIMLGTNDVKERFNANAACIGAGMERLIQKCKTVDCWGGKEPNILVVAPPRIKEGFHDEVMGDGCVEKSKGVAGWYKIIAERNNVHFLDAEGCEFNQIDFMHLTRKGHAQLAEKLAEMEKRRGESRKARAKTGMPVVSLVGYTNVGKSSLMNALCGPSVAEADMLFATLDPTSRKLVLPSGMAVLLVDTVGFVSRLPHNLVEAFKSTLEEAAWSDVIVRVADAGDDQREEQLAITDEVLDGLDCADIPRLTVYNKCDKPNALNFDPDILLTSAKTGYGLDALLKKLDELLSDRVHTIRVLLPYDKLGLAAPMRERGSVQVEEYREDGLYLEGIVKTEDLHYFEGYLV